MKLIAATAMFTVLVGCVGDKRPERERESRTRLQRPAEVAEVSRPQELLPRVGQHVAVIGKFSVGGGVTGPFVVVGTEPVYLICGRSAQLRGALSAFEGKSLRVSGTLRHVHGGPAQGPSSMAPAPDYFSFDCDEVGTTIELPKR